MTDIHPDGPADRAGLKTGDIITGIDGRPVDDPQSLLYRIAIRPVGETAMLDVFRSGESLQLPIELQVAPEIPPRNVTDIGGRNPLTGARIANLSPPWLENSGSTPSPSTAASSSLPLPDSARLNNRACAPAISCWMSTDRRSSVSKILSVS